MKIRNFCIMIFCILLPLISRTQDEESFKKLIVPESGIWWNSSQSGTGISLQFNREGNWFAALYLYHNFGHPTFLTMQGTHIDYSLSRTKFTNNAYAKITSAIYESDDGRCLGCIYTPPSTEVVSGIRGEILFINKGHAIFKITGEINFEEEIRNDLLINLPILSTNKPNQRSVIFLGNGYNKNLLTEVREGISVTGFHPYKFNCIDCNTNPTSQLLIENMGYSTGHHGFNLILKSTVNNEPIQYNYVYKVDYQNNYRNITNIYGIIDEQTAIDNSLPTQIIIQQSISQ